MASISTRNYINTIHELWICMNFGNKRARLWAVSFLLESLAFSHVTLARFLQHAFYRTVFTAHFNTSINETAALSVYIRINTFSYLLQCISACSKNLFNMSGYFYTPSFPGYYLDDMVCTWYITVPFSYIIHLKFQEFRLNDHPKCEHCFVQIFDGKDTKAPTLGRFCGYVYPPLLVSSSNHFTIEVFCRGEVHNARFKAFYYSVSGMWSILRLVCVSTTFVHLKKQRKPTRADLHVVVIWLQLPKLLSHFLLDKKDAY